MLERHEVSNNGKAVCYWQHKKLSNSLPNALKLKKALTVLDSHLSSVLSFQYNCKLLYTHLLASKINRTLPLYPMFVMFTELMMNLKTF